MSRLAIALGAALAATEPTRKIPSSTPTRRPLLWRMEHGRSYLMDEAVTASGGRSPTIIIQRWHHRHATESKPASANDESAHPPTEHSSARVRRGHWADPWVIAGGNQPPGRPATRKPSANLGLPAAKRSDPILEIGMRISGSSSSARTTARASAGPKALLTADTATSLDVRLCQNALSAHADASS